MLSSSINRAATPPADKIKRSDIKADSACKFELDLDIFGAREIRDVLKSKAHCLAAGMELDHEIIQIFDQIRAHYVGRVGLSTYLNQMLGNLGQTQIQNCRLFQADGRLIKLQFRGDHTQPAQRFIAKHFQAATLPFKVEVHRALDSDRVEIRYL